MIDKKDKVLLITGASSDVGIELLKKICSSYTCLYLQYRNMNDNLCGLIKEMDKELNVVPIECDLSSSNSVETMMRIIRSYSVLPNHIVHLAAPKVKNGYFIKKNVEDFDMGWNISVRSIVRIIQEFIPDMQRNRYGRILFMLSANTVGIPPKFQSEYVTIKYALLGLLKSLSEEYKSKGITVNGVSPDMMETRFLSEVPHLIVENYAEKRATGRNVAIQEIIPVIEYILSDAGASMTGQNICIGES